MVSVNDTVGDGVHSIWQSHQGKYLIFSLDKISNPNVGNTPFSQIEKHVNNLTIKVGGSIFTESALWSKGISLILAYLWMFLSFRIFDDFFRFSKNSGFGNF